MRRRAATHRARGRGSSRERALSASPSSAISAISAAGAVGSETLGAKGRMDHETSTASAATRKNASRRFGVAGRLRGKFAQRPQVTDEADDGGALRGVERRRRGERHAWKHGWGESEGDRGGCEASWEERRRGYRTQGDGELRCIVAQHLLDDVHVVVRRPVQRRPVTVDAHRDVRRNASADREVRARPRPRRRNARVRPSSPGVGRSIDAGRGHAAERPGPEAREWRFVPPLAALPRRAPQRGRRPSRSRAEARYAPRQVWAFQRWTLRRKARGSTLRPQRCDKRCARSLGAPCPAPGRVARPRCSIAGLSIPRRKRGAAGPGRARDLRQADPLAERIQVCDALGLRARGEPRRTSAHAVSDKLVTGVGGRQPSQRAPALLTRLVRGGPEGREGRHIGGERAASRAEESNHDAGRQNTAHHECGPSAQQRKPSHGSAEARATGTAVEHWRATAEDS